MKSDKNTCSLTNYQHLHGDSATETLHCDLIWMKDSNDQPQRSASSGMFKKVVRNAFSFSFVMCFTIENKVKSVQSWCFDSFSQCEGQMVMSWHSCHLIHWPMRLTYAYESYTVYIYGNLIGASSNWKEKPSVCFMTFYASMTFFKLQISSQQLSEKSAYSLMPLIGFWLEIQSTCIFTLYNHLSVPDHACQPKVTFPIIKFQFVWNLSPMESNAI